MPVNFTPSLQGYSNQGAFRYWCQTTIPLVYDDSKSYLELLYSVINYLNNTISDVANMGENIDALLNAYNQLQAYVNDYFDNLDVQEEINNKLDDMASNGTLDNLLEPFVQTFVSDWLEENLTPTTPPIDTTLSISGAGADALTVGKRALLSSNVFVTSANVAQYPDCDTLTNNRIYYISYTANIAHAPFTDTFTLFNTGWNDTQDHGYGGQVQIAIEAETGKIKTRHNNGTAWTDWKITGNDVIISSPSTFIDDIARAELNEGTVVYLTPGEYNLFSLKSEADWISDSINTRYCGVILKKGIKLIGRPGAVIKANYTGSNSEIKENFSIFNIAGDCELDGLECEGTNICYIVHDDPRIASANVNNAVIKNCKMTHLGTDHTFAYGSPICIGAGIGNSTRRVYKDNVVSATRTNPINIHTATGGKGYYIIKGNICVNGTIRLTSYGDGTGIMEGAVRNNLCAETPTKAADTNIKAYIYQNEVVS